jgi:GNAT superfamily N-acetyltransferase
MSLAVRLRQEITRYAPRDRGLLREFQREQFGAQARQLDEEHFEWLFNRNPWQPSEGPQLWICKKDGKVVGQQAGVPFHLKVGRRYCRASWAIDLMVDPRWRLRGVGPALSEVYTASNEITVGLGISDAAHKAFLRAGWLDLGTVPLYVRPLDVNRMPKGRFPGDGGHAWVGRMANPVVRLFDMVGGTCARWKGAILRPVEQFDERVDALWDAVCGRYAVIARRDFRGLHWRFDALPDRHDYRRFCLMEGDTLRGYAVIRMAICHGAAAGIVVDYLAAPEWLRPLFARGVEYLRNAGAAAVYCTTLGPGVGAWTHPLGFVRRESGVRLMVRLSEAVRTLSRAVANARHWFITLADSDADYHHHQRAEGRSS